MNSAVKIKNLSFSYAQGKPILQNASMTLSYGEVTLLAGLSGEGKSTIFNIINGIIPNATHGTMSGEVIVAQQNIYGKSISEISQYVGSVLQNPELQIIQPTVKDEIAFGCENIGVPPQLIHERIVSSCQILELDMNEKSHKLSGGQKQKLITATTIAMGQKILILDEPLANLDKASSKLLLERLRQLAHENGYAIMIIEHRLDMLISYVDKLYTVKDKKIVPYDDKTAFVKNFAKKIERNANPNKCTQTLFDIENVSHDFKKKVVLDDVSFGILKGERVVILGQNGCGKTTLTRIIARLLKPKKGNAYAYFDGGDSIQGERDNDRDNGGNGGDNIQGERDNGDNGGDNNFIVRKRAKKQKKLSNRKWFKKVGYVYQNPNYQLFMPTVGEEILFSGHSLEYCQKIVDLFELGDILDRHPHSLSEGQKRKVTIASVLASKPDVIILDEPTVGQDYNGLSKLVEIINIINKENKTTFITITHDMRCVESLCDKAIIIENGKITKVGDSETAKSFLA